MSVQATRLLVLGALRLRQPTHGYDIQRELTSWNADQWANIARSSVYNQLRTLTREGHISVVAIAQDEKRPSKTLYTITPSGEAEFIRLLHEIISNERPQPLDILPALCFLPALTKAEVLDALDKRVRIIDGFLESFDSHMQSWFKDEGNARYIREVFLLTREAFIGERTWARAFRIRVQADEYRLTP